MHLGKLRLKVLGLAWTFGPVTSLTLFLSSPFVQQVEKLSVPGPLSGLLEWHIQGNRGHIFEGPLDAVACTELESAPVAEMGLAEFR